jgi:hypothetical protein
MTTKRGFLVVVAAAAVFGAAYSVTKVTWAQAQIKTRVPFTATIEQHVYRSTPHPILKTSDVVTRLVLAFRSDGNQSLTVHQPDGSLPITTISDVNKLEYRIHDSATKKWHALNMHPKQAAQKLKLYKQCDDQFYEPGITVRCEPQPTKILGFEVWKVSYTLPPNGKGVTTEREFWVAPELNWYPLIRKSIENGRLEALEEVKQIRLGEPDAALFEIAADYQQVDLPSEFLSEAEIARGRPSIPQNSHGARMLNAKPRPPCLQCGKQ